METTSLDLVVDACASYAENKIVYASKINVREEAELCLILQMNRVKRSVKVGPLQGLTMALLIA